MVNGTLSAIVIIISLFGMSEALYCCTVGENNTDVSDKCSTTIYKTTVVHRACAYCRKQLTEKDGKWSTVRDCVHTQEVARCTPDTPARGTMTCYCNTDNCNGAAVFSYSLTITLLVLVITMYLQ